MIKVFLSHQSADSKTAEIIANRLRLNHGIDCYLDVIDPYINKSGEDLASHIQTEMGKCTQLLAVVSSATKDSQWVPWEIGVATEKDYPLATFSAGNILPPEFLRKWPYLRTDNDLDEYAKASRAADNSLIVNRSYLNESRAKTRSTQEFYVKLRAGIGQ